MDEFIGSRSISMSKIIIVAALLCVALCMMCAQATPIITKTGSDGINFDVKITGNDLKDANTAMETSWQVSDWYINNYGQLLNTASEIENIVETYKTAVDSGKCLAGDLFSCRNVIDSAIGISDVTMGIMDFLRPSDIPQDIKDANRELAPCIVDPECITSPNHMLAATKLLFFYKFHNQLLTAIQHTEFNRHSNGYLSISANSLPRQTQMGSFEWSYKVLGADQKPIPKPKIMLPVSGQIMPRDCNNILWQFTWSPVPGDEILYDLYVKCQGSSTPLFHANVSGTTYFLSTTIPEENLDKFECKVRAYVNGLWSDYSDTVLFKVTPANCGYLRTNEYWDAATSGTASCVPGSAKATCDTTDSCVSCTGKCYKPGTYSISGGSFTCSGGKWKQDTSSSKPPKIISPLNGQRMPKVCYDPVRWSFVWTPVSGATNYELYVQRQGSIKPLIDIETPGFTYDWDGTGGVMSGDNILNWQCKVRAYMNGAWGDYSDAISFSVEACNTQPGYPRTNEYWDTATAGTASCAPGSATQSCDTSDSCVSCTGKCYKPGTYSISGGSFTCSGGKWKQAGYPRTNEYWDAATAGTASCVPGSAKATCDTTDSCISCTGKCYKPGTYSISGGSFTCSGGKWKQAGYPRTNEYWDAATAGKSSCTTGSKQATCSSPDSCVSCGSNCYPTGTHSINGENYLCVQGKWRLLPSQTPEQACAAQGKIYQNGQCITPQDQAAQACAAQGKIYQNGQCISPQDQAAQACAAQGKIYQNGQCITPQDQAAQACAAQGKVYQNGQCITPQDQAAQACAAQGKIYQNGQCITPEQVCQANGGIYQNGQCNYPPPPPECSPECVVENGVCRCPKDCQTSWVTNPDTGALICCPEGLWHNGTCLFI